MPGFINKGPQVPVAKENGLPGKLDLAAAGAILLYCCLYACLRLLVSSTMELDEAGQFIDGASFSFGYAHQAPLYSWLVYALSRLCGMNIQTLIATKYIIIFLFYFSFYLTARTFWKSGASLLITGTLLLFPTYAYEFNRDLSHSILVTAMASVTCYFFVRLLVRGRTGGYVLFGVSMGLGLLSKYNFAFFLAALVLAALSFHEGRKILLDKRMFVSLVTCAVIIAPHVVWLFQNDFLPFRHALTKAEVGSLQLGAAHKILHIVMSSYSGVFIFFAIFFLFLGFGILRRSRGDRLPPGLSFFRYLAVYGLITPFLAIIVLRTGHFSERWLTPLLFALPLAVFSGVDMQERTRAHRLLGYLCLFIAGAILAARALIGFSPDYAGKVERIHTPFRHVSFQLKQEMRERGSDDLEKLTIIADSEFLAANMQACLPGSKSLLIDSGHPVTEDTLWQGTSVLVWDAGKRGANVPEKFTHQFPSLSPLPTIAVPFLRSTKFHPFVLGAAIIQKR